MYASVLYTSVLTNSTCSVEMLKSQNSSEQANSTRQPSLDNTSTHHTAPEPDLNAMYTALPLQSGQKCSAIPQLTAVNFESKPHGTALQRYDVENPYYEACHKEQLTSEKRPSLNLKPNNVQPGVLAEQTRP